MTTLIGWQKFCDKVMRWYKGGRDFDSVFLLKIVLVHYLYNFFGR